ncbi:unnamed protein product [Linum tenue]|uniref:Uncharacterized protein n=1 Tax=Linum tenue TaxID=586396 RepID=A0AAV0H336_9ROSI|nr:unnamed protein product [Linum tenue]
MTDGAAKNPNSLAKNHQHLVPIPHGLPRGLGECSVASPSLSRHLRRL